MRDIRVQTAPPAFKHIGLYGFRRTFLLKFSELPQKALELSESLDQLLAVEHGYGIH